MKVFLSHARKDDALARKLAERLTRSGFTVWNSEDEIVPGENWATKMGRALDDSDLMVVLLTPGALESDWLRQNIEFALGSSRYEGRVFSVLVGLTDAAGKDVPWILLRLPHRLVDSARSFGDVVKDIRALSAADVSHSNA